MGVNAGLTLECPRMPNYIIIIQMPGTGSRQEGFKENPSISVGDLTPEQIEGLCEEWCQKFKQHCANVKAQKKVR